MEECKSVWEEESVCVGEVECVGGGSGEMDEVVSYVRRTSDVMVGHRKSTQSYGRRVTQ